MVPETDPGPRPGTREVHEQSRGEAPLVSVVVPVYNAAKFLAETLESVLAQTYPRLEVLLADDGSRDGSREIARRFERENPGRFRLLTHPGGANRGVAATRNLALAHARGSLIAFLDADDLWLPEKTARQVAFMLRRPEVGISYTDAAIFREGDGSRWLPGTETLGHEPEDRTQANLLRILTISLNYIFSAVMVRADVIREVGGFVERLPFQSEDRIMVAMVAANHHVGRIPQVLARYRAHGESYTATVVRSKTINLIVFDMQVRVMRWLLARGQRPEGVDLAVRLLPGSFLRTLPRLRLRHLGTWVRNLLAIAAHLPHLPVIVLRDRLAARTSGGRRG